MSDKTINLDVDGVLELEYLVEEISDNSITVQSGDASDLGYISRDVTVLDPSSTGIYKLEINSQIVKVQVFDIIDNFNDGSMNEYSIEGGDGTNFVYETQSSVVYDGEYAARLQAKDSGGTTYISSSSGLDNYPTTGDIISYQNYLEPESISGFMFGVQDANNRYRVQLWDGSNGDLFSLYKRSNGSLETLAEKNLDPPTQEWLNIRVEWGETGDIIANLYDSTGSFIDSISGTDTEYSDGGIGMTIAENGSGDNRSAYYDSIKLI